MIARLEEMLEDSAWRYVCRPGATRIDRSSGQNATVQVSD